MRDRINSLVKKREGFRPFAPVVASEAAQEYFDIAPGDEECFAHMLYVTQVRRGLAAELPAVTHVDGSARVQTISEQHNPRLWTLLNAFEAVSGIPILLNTSFNVKGEPIVCTPQEALNTFSTAHLDLLVLGDYLVEPKPAADRSPPATVHSQRDEWRVTSDVEPPVTRHTSLVTPAVDCLHRPIEARAREDPNSIAVVYRNQQITYGELNARANQVASYLAKLGVGPETLVGICTDRSLDMLVGLLGILKAGGAYVPLDPTYPFERLRFMVTDAQVRVLLTQEHLGTWSVGASERASVPGDAPTLHAPTLHAIVRLDADWASISQEPAENVDRGIAPHHLAYVIYTSGSTGKPKGVMVEHGNVLNFFAGMDERISHRPGSTWLAVTSPSFDISVLELFWTLARGFKVVLCPGELVQL